MKKNLLYLLLLGSAVSNAQCLKNVESSTNTFFAIKEDNSLWSWAKDSYFSSNMGNGTGVTNTFPNKILTNNTWIKIFSGANKVYAVSANNELWAWGTNVAGSLGNGKKDGLQVYIPEKITANNEWVNMSFGSSHSLALKADGSLWGWGANKYGELGNSSLGDTVITPSRIDNSTDWASIASNTRSNFALKKNGTLWFWGEKSSWIDTAATIINKPIQVGIDTDWKSIQMGYWHTLFIKQDSTLWGIGQNAYGELGESNFRVPVKKPTLIDNTNKWLSAAAGSNHTYAIRKDSTLWGWGSNYSRQLGVPSNTVPYSLEPVQIPGITKATKIVSLREGGGVITQDKYLWVFGDAPGRKESMVTIPAIVDSMCHTDESINNWNFNLSYGTFNYKLCNATIYDNGGATSNYSKNINTTITVYPTIPDSKVHARVRDLKTQQDKDYLTIYSGNSVNSSGYMGKWSGDLSGLDMTFRSTSPDGAITVVFISNNDDITGAGFKLTFTCESGNISELDETKLSDASSAFPNPVNDILYLAEKTEFKIMNQTGQVILYGNDDHVDVSQLELGLYFLMANNKSMKILKY